MATSKAQRWGILTVTIAMVVGTLGSFLVMILSTNDSQEAAQRYQTAQSAYQKESQAYQQLVSARDDRLSEQYYAGFKQYATHPAKYSIESINELRMTDLKAGDGATIDDATKFAAYYIGWNPDGKVFDQSLDSDKLKGPFAIDGLKETSVIDGWKEGLQGMKLGGVRLLEVPSDKAYGEKGQGNDIPPNTPLKFVVMAIPAPEEVPEPESMTKAYEAYQKATIEYYTQAQ